jgi:hypothetical protein
MNSTKRKIYIYIYIHTYVHTYIHTYIAVVGYDRRKTTLDEK